MVVQWVGTLLFRNESSVRKNDPPGTNLNQFPYDPSFVPNLHESDAIRDAICDRVFDESCLDPGVDRATASDRV